MYILYYTQYVVVDLVCNIHTPITLHIHELIHIHTHSYYTTHIHIHIYTYFYTTHIHIYTHIYTPHIYKHTHTCVHIYRLYRYVPMVRHRLLLLYLPLPWVTLPRQLLDHVRTSFTYYMAFLCTCCGVYVVFLSVVVSGSNVGAWVQAL